MLRALRGHYLTVLTVIYFGATSGFMISNNTWPGKAQIIILCLMLGLLFTRPVSFLKDWSPFLALFLAFQYLRGIVPQLGWRVHIHEMIRADEFLFGSLPTVTLQRLLYVDGHPRFHDYFFSFIYLSHFLLPLVPGLVLWYKDRQKYYRFLGAMALLTFAGFMTYLLFPAMPPWMASQKGFIPPLDDITSTTLQTIVNGVHFGRLYRFMDPNPVAAMPSLHAAYPILVYLFLLRFYGRKAHFFLPYVIAVLFGIIYTGQHYVVDALAGAIYAGVVFVFVEFCWVKIAPYPQPHPVVVEAQVASPKSRGQP